MLNAGTTEPGRLIKRYLTLLLFFYFIDAAALSCSISLSLGLIYGPLIFITAIRGADNRMVFSSLHIFPFLVFSFVNVLSEYGKLFGVSWVGIITQIFNAGYALVMAVSVFFYGIAYLFFIKKNKMALHYKTRQLLSILCFVMAAYAVTSLFPGLRNIAGASIFPMYIFSGVSVVFITYYKIRQHYETGGLETSSESALLSGKAPDEMMLRLKESIEAAQLYRNPSLTPDMLAAKLNLPKDDLFAYLSSNLGKSYYQLVAEYRIAYAKNRLEEDVDITIEALAYECGFNSKTSLNKYFKEITGLAPSQYRADSK